MGNIAPPTPTLPRCGRWRVLQGRGYSGLFLFYSTVNGFGYATGADGIGAVTASPDRPYGLWLSGEYFQPEAEDTDAEDAEDEPERVHPFA